ncbi:MAG: GNAT family N-acetyltransferase [Phycisphaerales bacterium]
MPAVMPTLVTPTTPEQLDTVRALFREYEENLGISLCFQGFEQELANLPGKYAPPSGRLYLAMMGPDAAGCIALREITHQVADFFADPRAPKPAGRPPAGRICEMKRLYVRPEFRGNRIGRLLARRLLDDARAIGYATMHLDTMDTLKPAVELYRSLGFQPTQRYNNDEDPHTLFFAKALGP